MSNTSRKDHTAENPCPACRLDDCGELPFTGEYALLREAAPLVRETGPKIPESLIQRVWSTHLFSQQPLRTDGGQKVRIIAPGWWNRAAGPDFKGAQIEFDGDLLSGDVEIHLNHAAWFQHCHDSDPRYSNVLLACALESSPPRRPLTDARGRIVPTLSLVPLLAGTLDEIAKKLPSDDAGPTPSAHCVLSLGPDSSTPLLRMAALAGEWRILNKARNLDEIIDRSGADQAIYEAFMEACGYQRFKKQFRTVARHLPYDRVKQLARQDPFLLEAAMLHIAGLLPGTLDSLHDAAPHWKRLQSLRQEKLPGMKPLPLVWERICIRPNNAPERRMAGAARFLARTTQNGLARTLDEIWNDDLAPRPRRMAFEALFPKPIGFWCDHHTWTSKTMAKPCAMLGKGRVLSIIGNVFVPAALALARRRGDRLLEERIREFLKRLPKEPQNHLTEEMSRRLFGPTSKLRLTFLTQQGILQIYHDWCEINPSCRNCTLLSFIDSGR